MWLVWEGLETVVNFCVVLHSGDDNQIHCYKLSDLSLSRSTFQISLESSFITSENKTRKYKQEAQREIEIKGKKENRNATHEQEELEVKEEIKNCSSGWGKNEVSLKLLCLLFQVEEEQ